jgi:hypothetical protein
VSKAERYRGLAAEYEGLASRASSDETRRELLQIAIALRSMAERLEKMQDGFASAGIAPWPGG